MNLMDLGKQALKNHHFTGKQMWCRPIVSDQLSDAPITFGQLCLIKLDIKIMAFLCCYFVFVFINELRDELLSGRDEIMHVLIVYVQGVMTDTYSLILMYIYRYHRDVMLINYLATLNLRLTKSVYVGPSCFQDVPVGRSESAFMW